MNHHRTFITSSISIVLLALATACGSAAPPSQLLKARQAYDMASQGPAATLAPARLHTAKQALDAAEDAFQSEPESQKTVDLSYVAQRKAEVAHYDAKIIEASEARTSALDEARSHTRGALRRTKKRLAAERRGREATAAELASEREKRQEAERRAAEAMARLREALRKIATIKEEPRGTVITLSGSVLFRSGKYELMSSAKQKLSSVAEALVASEDRPITIEGHTDSRGSDESNLTLSQNRANAVRSYLISQRINATRIRAKGIGESRPIASNDTAEGRANNRRVEIIIGAAPEPR